ncbi:hypothetical protein HELRODRAFT_178072 [Helobdella robusta]|uniref:Uncharacterized protein n=1 Tax=Helobdella robusta TaxID=6412 RepID=T1FCP5_HELRO|nr:hypothetical protein HELRODRAFT_178072 [Helobdella robusta]ESN97628.1 hypothetical protein HELRODRAFT_178072 [Helobdella robusta]
MTAMQTSMLPTTPATTSPNNSRNQNFKGPEKSIKDTREMRKIKLQRKVETFKMALVGCWYQRSSHSAGTKLITLGTSKRMLENLKFINRIVNDQNDLLEDLLLIRQSLMEIGLLSPLHGPRFKYLQLVEPNFFFSPFYSQKSESA